MSLKKFYRFLRCAAILDHFARGSLLSVMWNDTILNMAGTMKISSVGDVLPLSSKTIGVKWHHNNNNNWFFIIIFIIIIFVITVITIIIIIIITTVIRCKTSTFPMIVWRPEAALWWKGLDREQRTGGHHGGAGAAQHALNAIDRRACAYSDSCKPQTVGWESFVALRSLVRQASAGWSRRRRKVQLCSACALSCCGVAEFPANGRLRKERHEEAGKGSGGRRAYGTVP